MLGLLLIRESAVWCESIRVTHVCILYMIYACRDSIDGKRRELVYVYEPSKIWCSFEYLSMHVPPGYFSIVLMIHKYRLYYPFDMH